MSDKHPDLAIKLNNLSRPLLQQGKYDEAAARSSRGPADRDRRVRRPAPVVANYKVNLGRVHLARKDAASAEPLLRQALEIRRRAFPEGDWRIAMAKSLLGEALTSLGRYDEAERLLLEAKADPEGRARPRGPRSQVDRRAPRRALQDLAAARGPVIEGDRDGARRARSRTLPADQPVSRPRGRSGRRARGLAGALRIDDPALAADVEMLLQERSLLSREGFLEEAALKTPASTSLEGQTIGASSLISLIGQGGMGSVWLARRSDGRFEGRPR